LFGLYERALCRCSAGFIGWTPYLVGRALTFGTPRALTAAGWAPFTRTDEERRAARRQVRAQLGIPQDALVVGIAGALVWARRFGYSYGAELVHASLRARRPDLRVLIIGDGTGRSRLERIAGQSAGRTVLFTGRVPQSDVPDYLAAMDVGSLPQSVDCVGSVRYTTKISEYLSARLPVVTGELPFAYDLDEGWLWRLPGSSPWSTHYIQALVDFLERVTAAEIQDKGNAIPRLLPIFDRERQVARVTAFVNDLLAARCRPKSWLMAPIRCLPLPGRPPDGRVAAHGPPARS
jgi:hypothetical protein